MNAYYRMTLMRMGILAFALSIVSAHAEETKVTLTGEGVVPSIATAATGTAVITVTTDRVVRGNITTSNITGTAAHIHLAAAGQNGPAIIALIRTSDTVWTVPDTALLTEAQYESYEAGNLYIDVHSDAYKSGEIRAQIRP